MIFFILGKPEVILDSCIALLQCLQALEKLSREQPLACLQAGAIMAVLNYIDFFSTSIQVIKCPLCSCSGICGIIV